MTLCWVQKLSEYPLNTHIIRRLIRLRAWWVEQLSVSLYVTISCVWLLCNSSTALGKFISPTWALYLPIKYKFCNNPCRRHFVFDVRRMRSGAATWNVHSRREDPVIAKLGKITAQSVVDLVIYHLSVLGYQAAHWNGNNVILTKFSFTGCTRSFTTSGAASGKNFVKMVILPFQCNF